MPGITDDRAAVTSDVRAFILAEFLPGDPGDSLRDDDLLLEGGIVDSGSVISLAAFLEERFGIRVDDDDLVLDNFATVLAVVDFVLGKQSASCASC
jgi:acyl carrier protein